MTLHDTTELVKKAGLGSVLGILGIILIVIFVRVGIMVKNFYFPPKIDPPTRVYGNLPPLQFPQSNVNITEFTYISQTTSGELPVGLPDRLSVFPVLHPAPNFLNLDKAKAKITALGFTEGDGSTPVKELQLQDPYYEWDERKDFNRRITFNINNFDFNLVSDYLSSLYVVNPQFLPDEKAAIKTVTRFLDKSGLTPNDLDLAKTNNKDDSLHYITFPELYAVQTDPQGTSLVRATSLSSTNVIRVELYQKDLEYDLITGEGLEFKPKIHVKIPILYPHPPYSTMDFKVASGQMQADVVEASFTHQNLDISNTTATYRIKTPQVAWDELKNKKAYIAAYYGADSNIFVKNIYLAYYLGNDPQDYLMPIYVFEGNNGFFAYVSAVTEDQLKK